MKLLAVFGAALVSISQGVRECAEADSTILLQQGLRHAQTDHADQGVQLLENAHNIISKINNGEDPEGCGMVSDATRAAVEELLPTIFDQHSHWSNQITIAAAAVGSCTSQGDLAQKGIDLQTARKNHQECRSIENRLQDGLEECQKYAALRSSAGSPCFTFPNDESGFAEAVKLARDQLDVTFKQAELLQETCASAREDLATQQEECTAAQRRFEGDYCAYRSDCGNLQSCHAEAEEIYTKTLAEAQEALETLRAEYQTLKHVQCLLTHADTALKETTIIDGEAVAACSEPAATDELTIEFPMISPPVACEADVISRLPCQADFFAVEYQSLPQHAAIQAACVSCPGVVDEEPDEPVEPTTPPAPPAPPAPPLSNWVKTTRDSWCGQSNKNMYAASSSQRRGWKLDTYSNGGWRWCAITPEECQQECANLGDCAGIYHTPNNCCFPTQSVCEGNTTPGGPGGQGYRIA